MRLIRGLGKLVVEELEANKERKAAGYVKVSLGFATKMFERLTNGEPMEELLNKRAKDLMSNKNESQVSTKKAVARAKAIFGRK